GDRVRLRYEEYFGATFASALLVAACAAVAVLPPGRWGRRRRDRTATAARTVPGSPRPGIGGTWLPSVAVPLLLVPAGALFLESGLPSPPFPERYVLFRQAPPPP